MDAAAGVMSSQSRRNVAGQAGVVAIGIAPASDDVDEELRAHTNSRASRLPLEPCDFRAISRAARKNVNGSCASQLRWTTARDSERTEPANRSSWELPETVHLRCVAATVDNLRGTASGRSLPTEARGSCLRRSTFAASQLRWTTFAGQRAD